MSGKSERQTESSKGIRCLHEEFTSLSQRNVRYSLRAFAKDIGISHTLLSLIMAGKRPLSTKTARLVSQRLALSPEKAALLHSTRARRRSKKINDSYEYIDLATFNLISDWVHFAILSLLDTTTSKITPKWIAKRLGINEMQAKVSFQRLADIGMIAQVDGRWRQTGKKIKIENKVSTSITKKFHRQMMVKALESLEKDPIEVRNFSSTTLAIDPSNVDFATQEIIRFRQELAAKLEARGNQREVYNLTVQFYPVSKPGESP